MNIVKLIILKKPLQNKFAERVRTLTRPLELVRPITVVEVEGLESVREILLWQDLQNRLEKISGEMGHRSLMAIPNDFSASDVFSEDIDVSDELSQELLENKNIEFLGLAGVDWAIKYVIKPSEESSSGEQEVLVICRPNVWLNKNHKFFIVGDSLNQAWIEEVIRAYITKMEILVKH